VQGSKWSLVPLVLTPVKLSVTLHPFAFSHQWIGKTHLRVTKPEYTHVISKAQTLSHPYVLFCVSTSWSEKQVASRPV